MKMKKVAPAMPYEGDIPLEKGCQWLLNLDMVESNTGRIIQKNMVHPEDIGNSTTKFGVENVLYSKLRPYLNKVVIPEEYGFVTTEMIPLRPDKKYLTSMFISMLLRGDAFVNFINSKVAGTKMPRVSMNVFWNIDVILPPMLLQEQFAAFVHQSDKSKFVLHTKELKIKRVITNGGKL
jgi:type I restriction enzyme S subunit